MVPTSPLRRIRSFFRRARREAPPIHPEAEAPLTLPRRIDGPVAASQLARDLLRNHQEDITLAIYLDERHRLAGAVILTVGWVQAVRLSARPVLAGAMACRAATCILVRHGRSRGPGATEQEQASFGALSAACGRSGLAVVDHLVVVG